MVCQVCNQSVFLYELALRHEIQQENQDEGLNATNV